MVSDKLSNPQANKSEKPPGTEMEDIKEARYGSQRNFEVPPTPQPSLDLGHDFDPAALLQSTLKDAPDYVRQAIAKLVAQQSAGADVAGRVPEAGRGASVAAALVRSGVPVAQAAHLAQLAQHPAARIDAETAVTQSKPSDGGPKDQAAPATEGNKGGVDTTGDTPDTDSYVDQNARDSRRPVAETASIAAAFVHDGLSVDEASHLAESAAYPSDLTDAASSVTYVKSPAAGLANPVRIPPSVFLASSDSHK